MTRSEAQNATGGSLVAVLNRHGSSRLILVCEHASNYIPPAYARLGLSAADLRRHIAWDIGALVLAQHLAARLDATLIYATHSRLLLDLNRDPAAPDSIVEISEDTPIPGNMDLSAEERAHRCHWLYEPFHRELGRVIDHRLRTRKETAVLSIHSFTPNYKDSARPWHAGVISQRDRRLAQCLLTELGRDPELNVGDNQPYSAADGVYHTLGRHAEARGLTSALLEIRNDLIEHAPGRKLWADRLHQVLQSSLQLVFERDPLEPGAALSA